MATYGRHNGFLVKYEEKNGNYNPCRNENSHQISMGSVKGFKCYSHLNYSTPEL
jgi:hypothetical protein